MATEVDICNLALDACGVRPLTIATLPDPPSSGTTMAARTCALWYPLVRDEVLAEHPFPSTVKRSKLTRRARSPKFGPDHAYVLPDDFLALKSPEFTEQQYRLENQDDRLVIVSSASTMNITYIARPSDAALFEPGLVTLIAARLAARICYKITKDSAMAEALARSSDMLGRKTMAATARQQPVDTVSSHRWVNARARAGSVFPPAGPVTDKNGNAIAV